MEIAAQISLGPPNTADCTLEVFLVLLEHADTIGIPLSRSLAAIDFSEF